MTTIEILREAVAAIAASTHGRAVVTDLERSSEQGDYFELRCVDPAARYAKLTVAAESDDHVAITVGSSGMAEYDEVPLDKLRQELDALAAAVIHGRVSEVKQLAADGELLASRTTVMIDGKPYRFRYRVAFRRLKHAEKIEVQYASYID